MKVGVIVPTFQRSSERAFAVARSVAEHELDGVFAYDHLWPLGRPDRPSLAPFPLLAAISQRVSGVVVAPLVARVGLVPKEILVAEFQTLGRLAPGRVIAALGTGDHLSRPEHDANGIAFPKAAERRAQLEDVLQSLEGELPLLVGAGGARTNALAREFGADLNFWNAEAPALRVEARDGPVSWAGDAPLELEDHLAALLDAGVTWAIFSSSVDLDRVGRWRERHSTTQ